MTCKRIVFILLGLVLYATAHAEDSGYRVVKKIQLGGEGGWGYLTLDSAARRLYVSRGTHVMVIDINDERVVGDIPDTLGARGIAVVHELNRGFFSNSKGDFASIFDLATLRVIGQVKTGKNPNALVYDPVAKKIFAFNASSHDVTVFDPVSGEVNRTIPLNGRPEFALTDGQGKIYVNIKDTSEVAEIDTRKLSLTKRISVRPGEMPDGIGFDSAHGRLFAGCHNQVMAIIDIAAGKVIATVPTGAGSDGIGFDPETGTAFSANGWEGTLSMVREASPGKFAVSEIPTQCGARTLIIDEKAHILYLPTAQLGACPMPAPGELKSKEKPPVIKDTFMILEVGK
jgi:DNA-binding beta-propeller fold protein YncE